MNEFYLKELLEIKNGRDYKHLSDGEIPVYGSGGLMKFVNEALYSGESILLPRKGTLTNIQYVNESFWTVDTIYYSVIDKTKAEPYYLYYYLKQLNLSQLNTGTGVPSMTFGAYYGIPIRLPNLPTQKSIAKVLSDLDAKIELNNKINQELEAMAKTLYDYWFVQFDFPCLPSDYRPSGQVNPNIDLAQKIKSVCTYRQTGRLPLPDGKKWFVYVILCQDGTFYKGITNDLYRRYYEHKTGQGAEWTKVHIPKKIIHYEEFETQQQAAKREKELKTGFGRTWIKREYDKFLKYGYPSKNGLPAHQTRLMMAGKMVYNEELKREIPEGWDKGELIDIANITMGQSPPGSTYNENGEGTIFYQGCTDFGNRFPTVRKFTTSPKRYANEGDILLSVRAPVGTLNIAKEDCCIGRGLAALNSKDDCIAYLFGVMMNLKQIFDNRNSAGTTFGSITKDDLFSLNVVLPSKEILERFNKILSPIFEKQNKIELENQQLTELRDWLLPMLMNGQVVVEN